MFKEIVEDIIDACIFCAKYILYSSLIILALVLVLLALWAGYIEIATNPNKARPLYIILLGSPESSKKTIGMVLSKKYKIPYLSVQDILNQNNTSEYSSTAEEVLIEKNITEHLLSKNAKNGLILNGYPYNLSQAESLHRFIRTTVQKHAFVIIVSAVEIYSDDMINQQKSKPGLILDYRCRDCTLDPVAERFKCFRGAIFIDPNKFTPEEYNTLVKEINNELSGFLFK